jgi:hypothetical protein
MDFLPVRPLICFLEPNRPTLLRRTSSGAVTSPDRCGHLLRVARRRDAEAETTLEAELSLTEAHVSIEKMRFAERLSVLLDIATETEMAMVPSFVLQRWLKMPLSMVCAEHRRLA